MSTKTLGLVGVALIVVFIAAVTVLGRGDDEASASQVDGAFLTGMAPHHEMAIEMAETAQDNAEHPEIKQLAADIVSAQTSEIETIEAIHQRLFDQPLAQGAHGDLGMSDEMMGMEMDMDALETAKPFDREFIDMMIPHHRGAIAMSRQLLKQGSDAALRKMASDIIRAQSAEIREMRAWRADWYGSGSGSTSMGG